MTVNHELIIIRYAEIGLKAKYTRKKFENALIKNIRKALKTKKLPSEIKKQRGRIYLHTKQIKESVNVLQKIFGIISISPAVKIQTDKQKIIEKAVKTAEKKIANKNSFALRVTREGKHEFTSQDIAIITGDAIVKKIGAKVNLTKPDYELFIEIRDKDTFFYEEKIQAPSGLPVYTQGKVLAIIDSKESILAAWYIIRRGCSVVFIIIDHNSKKNLEDFMKNWFLEFDILQIERNDDYFSNLNNIALEKNCNAIITGHTLYTKKEKTLEEITNYKKNSNIPVIHPLISINTNEINKKLLEIGVK